ncbi:hypothetical protein HK103_006825 [Boothiomyces macroporosus]|uniref:Acyltransferase 3 domain-containing protein n=1 Tax=Boothiomyces macroporosus TaxID=261099 RepID=A0AAD5Y6S6_9FUNG|nr:hypothetical protein HK103_006825 [Boothiomyces macroporosus]
MPDRFLFLDGIRGLAAFTVVLGHAMYTIPENGVDTFFVLSSFLLTLILYTKSLKLAEKGAGRNEWITMMIDYFIRRFLRVYPAFFVCAVMVSMLKYEDQQKAWFLKGRDYKLWEVDSVNADYYFFLQTACLLDSSRITVLAKRWWYIPVTLCIIKSLYGDYRVLRDGQSFLHMHINTFLNGSSFAIIYVQLKAMNIQKRIQESKYAEFVLDKMSCALGIWILSLGYKRLFMQWVFEKGITPGFPYSSIFLAILLTKECLIPGTVAKFFEWNFLVFAGKISFSLYLTHSFVLYLWTHQEDPINFFWYLLFASFSFAYLFYSLVEYPTTQFTNYISQWIKRKSSMYLPLNHKH